MTDRTDVDSDREALDLLIRGFQVSRMLRLVADLGIADKIVEHETCDICELAAACTVQPTPLLRVLRALAAFEVFRVGVNGRVGHSPRSLLLRTDAPNSMRHGARFWAGPGSWHAWGALDAALTGGVPHEAAWQTGRQADFSIFESIRRRLASSTCSWRTFRTTDMPPWPQPTSSPAPG